SLKKLWLKFIISPFAKNLIWHATSLQEEEMIKKVYAKANIWIIPNGIDIDKFKDNEHKKDKLFYKKYSDKVNENFKIIISMGRLQKVKGFDILINAISIAQREDTVLFIAGKDFGERKNLEKLIDKLGLRENVFFIGRIEGLEKVEFLRNADLFALASYHENFGMVYAEALAAGTPVIASTNTPWQDIEKYNCGKWIENTPEKFSKAIIEILNSDSIQMGNNGREYVEEKFSWDKIAVDFKKKIETIISSSKLKC
ncbi:MAG: glycosyltransferase, partial [Ignavibacterium sp.]|nr:glycosyltransferase [Ignavibacterium sp.]